MFNIVFFNKINLIHNILQIKKRANKQKICAMVKANAYGTGLKNTVKTLRKYVAYFGVSCVAEAVQAKKYTNKPILITGALDVSKITKRFDYTCNSFLDVQTLANTKKCLNIHLKINTGMNRYGVSSFREFEKCLNLIKSSNLLLKGVYTHFATTDNYVEQQTQVFLKFLSILKKHNLKPIIHADNSHVFDLQQHNFDMIRIGFNLYDSSLPPYMPVAEIETQITQINWVKANQLVGYNRRYLATLTKKVAVLPIGYADGFDMRYLGLKLNVAGKKCKVINICMDCLMLDITNTALKKGDKVKILSPANPLKLYADYSNTSEYEVMCKFSHIRAKHKIVKWKFILIIKYIVVLIC